MDLKTAKITKIYKPEILICPFCNGKLVYRYTVSNKVIQFSNGKYTRVKNLGYSCINEKCRHNEHIYSSQTASKLCVKGYTYSSKVLAMIYYYKQNHYSRERICDILEENNIQISDRNVDLIYNKYKAQMSLDYENNIIRLYNKMLEIFSEIRISIDFIMVNDSIIISVRDSFYNEQIGLHFFKKNDIQNIEQIIKQYIDNDKITYITTIRSITSSFQYIKKYANPNTKFISFLKD